MLASRQEAQSLVHAKCRDFFAHLALVERPHTHRSQTLENEQQIMSPGQQSFVRRRSMAKAGSVVFAAWRFSHFPSGSQPVDFWGNLAFT